MPGSPFPGPSRRAPLRFLALLVLALAGLVVFASPAQAQDDENRDDIVVLVGDVSLGESDVVDTLVVFDGDVVVQGTVRESLVVFSGDVLISGRVRDTVVVFSGQLTLTRTARVGSDVVTGDEPDIAPGAVVGGDVETIDVDFTFSAWSFGIFWHFAQWIAISISVLLLGILIVWLFPRAVDGTRKVGREKFWPAAGVGALAFIGLPIVAVFLIVTLVGLPFGLGLLLALGLIFAIGYVVGGIVLGSVVMRNSTSRWAHMFVGLLILRGVALIPVLDGIVGALVTLYGLGVVTIALWNSRSAYLGATSPAPAGPGVPAAQPVAQQPPGMQYPPQPPPPQYGAPQYGAPQPPPQPPPPPAETPSGPVQDEPTATEVPPAGEAPDTSGSDDAGPEDSAPAAPGSDDAGPAAPEAGEPEPGQDPKPEG